MPYRLRPSSSRKPARPAFVPLAHPSWGGYPDGIDLSQPLPAADFWTRLGL
jgi:hypothetical protein